MQATLPEPFCILTAESVRLHLYQGDSKQWKHNLRQALRSVVWRTDKAFQKRQDMDGASPIEYAPTVSLLRRSARPSKRRLRPALPALSLFEQTHLRNILVGSVRTQERLFKANCANSPVCPWCSTTQAETVEHLFWSCPTWQDVRAKFLRQYSGVIADAPPSVRLCGVLPQAFSSERFPDSDAAVTFCESLHSTMVSILCEREKKSQMQKATVVQAAAISQDPAAASADARDRLFPGYPWNFEREHTGSVFFTAKAPPNWRVYKKGSEWLFGVSLFEPLLWYWHSLRWPEPGPGCSFETASWLELAVDFAIATHCELAVPGSPAPSAMTAAGFFAGASRRLSAICNAPLAPYDGSVYATHVPSLTALGMGRCAGLRTRPLLMSPALVHDFLFKSALEVSRQARHKRDFALPSSLPAPLWQGCKLNRRLVGKQPASHATPAPRPRRVVRSHKQTVTDVIWSEEDQHALSW